MKFIWVTRGQTWGFRFLRTGGFPDPLPVYEQAFSNVDEETEVCCRVGEKLALRFPDPSGWKDRAGRIIPHEFVLFGSLADQIKSVEDGRKLIWPLVAEEFAGIWDQPKPPPPNP